MSFPTGWSALSPGLSRPHISPMPLADQFCGMAVSTSPKIACANSLASSPEDSPHPSRQQLLQFVSLAVRTALQDQQARYGASALAHLRRPGFDHRGMPGCDRTLPDLCSSAWVGCLWFVAAVPGLPHRSPFRPLATMAS